MQCSYELPIDEHTPKQCIRSLNSTLEMPKPLTTRDCQSWRKTLQHFDFSKMPESKTEKEYRKILEETKDTFYATQTKYRESRFVNFSRFKLKPAPKKAHDFSSDFPHAYLEKEESHRSPEYDTLNSR